MTVMSIKMQPLLIMIHEGEEEGSGGTVLAAEASKHPILPHPERAIEPY
jgi:hypothetical protein